MRVASASLTSAAADRRKSSGPRRRPRSLSTIEPRRDRDRFPCLPHLGAKCIQAYAAHAIHLYIMHPRVKAYSVAATTLHAHAHVLNRGDLPRRWKEAILSPRFVDFMPRPDWMICWRNCVRCIYRVHTRTRESREFPEMRDSNLRHALSLSLSLA